MFVNPWDFEVALLDAIKCIQKGKGGNVSMSNYVNFVGGGRGQFINYLQKPIVGCSNICIMQRVGARKIQLITYLQKLNSAVSAGFKCT